MENKVHFHNLDILRFICAIAVTVGHGYEAYTGWIGTPEIINHFPSIKHYIDIGTANLGLGVSIFFVISGFLITYLLLTEKNKFDNINIGKFIIRRSLRIWPLYYLAIIIGLWLVNYINSPAPDIWPNLLFWNNFHAIKTMQWQYPFAHFWSICIEEHFYLIWPLIVYLLPIKKILPATLLFISISVAYRYFSTLWVEEARIAHNIFLHTLSRMDEILIGAFIACIHFSKPIVFHIPLSIRLAVYSLFIFVIFIESQNDFWAWGMWSILFKKYVYLAFICFWLLNYLFNPNAFGNFKHKNILHYFGKISFGIYIYHNMILPIFITKIIYHFQLLSLPLYFTLYITFTLLVSILSFELFEKHFLKLKDKFALIKTER